MSDNLVNSSHLKFGSKSEIFWKNFLKEERQKMNNFKTVYIV